MDGIFNYILALKQRCKWSGGTTVARGTLLAEQRAEAEVASKTRQLSLAPCSPGTDKKEALLNKFFLSASIAILAISCQQKKPIVCTPGATQSCVCPNAQSGAQVCHDDGYGWQTCRCSGNDAGLRDSGAQYPDAATAERCGFYESLESHSGDYTIASEADIFGLANISCITGTLNIASNTLTIINSLNRLKRIEGDLIITSNPNIASIELSSLQEILGSISVYENGYYLSSISAPMLKSVGGDIGCFGSVQINIGMPELAIVGGSISLSNSALNAQSISDIGGGIKYSNITIDSISYPMITRITELEVVGMIGDIDLSSLTRVIKKIDLTSNNSTLYDFPSLAWVGDTIVLRGTELTDVRLDSLVSTAAIHIYGQKLDSVSMDLLETVTHDIEIGYGSLSNVDFPSLSNVGGIFSFCGSSEPPNIPLLNSVGKLVLNGTSSLPVVLNSIISVGYLEAVGADYVQVISIPNLVTVVSNLTVTGNSDLRSIGFPSLARVTGDLTIANNWRLRNSYATNLLTQLQTRQGVGGIVRIENNAPDNWTPDAGCCYDQGVADGQ